MKFNSDCACPSLIRNGLFFMYFMIIGTNSLSDHHPNKPYLLTISLFLLKFPSFICIHHNFILEFQGGLLAANVPPLFIIWRLHVEKGKQLIANSFTQQIC